MLNKTEQAPKESATDEKKTRTVRATLPGQVAIEIPTFKPKNECNVIKIIQREWERESERLSKKKELNARSSANEKSLV